MGTAVTLLTPDAAARRAMGPHMAASHRQPDAARAQATAAVDSVADLPHI